MAEPSIAYLGNFDRLPATVHPVRPRTSTAMELFTPGPGTGAVDPPVNGIDVAPTRPGAARFRQVGARLRS